MPDVSRRPRNTVEVFRLEADTCEPAGYFGAEHALVSPSLPSLEIPLTEIFRD